MDCRGCQNDGGRQGEPPEISRVVQDYMNVLVDWREEQVEMPKGNPWSWSYEQLQDYIKRRRKNGETNFGQS